jgi:phage repressor protein C with HTH and peptisase S24 domain
MNRVGISVNRIGSSFWATVPVLCGMNRITQLREERGWSQQDLADRLNTTSVSVGRYEKEDQRLTLPLLRRLGEVFQVSVADVIGDSGGFGSEHIPVPAYDQRAAAGAGAEATDGAPKHHLMFRKTWLQRLARDTKNLVILEIEGDSMWDTLHAGDHALVDKSQTNPRREGLYIIRIDNELLVKRLSVHPVTKLLTIKSDNAAYRTYEDIDPEEVAIFGRVVWIGRRLV